MTTIGIIGGGAWGTALAQCMAASDKKTVIWAMEKDVVDSINHHHENQVFLKGVPLNNNISATQDLSYLAKNDILFVVTPTQYLRKTITDLKPHISDDKTIVICSKGVEIESGLLPSQIVAPILPKNPIAILTGPTFAIEIAKGLPSAVTLAMKDKESAVELAEILANKTLRMYPSNDVIGAQIGGAVKNVIAIACGIINGKNMGDSARAALLTRGLAEIARLSKAMGADKETLMGMCGVGDLLLTCSSMQSRNFSLGVALGQGKSLTEILASRNSVTEGVYTAKALIVMARNNAVDMPISEAVYKCLSETVNIDDIIIQMLERPIKSERA